MSSMKGDAFMKSEKQSLENVNLSGTGRFAAVMLVLAALFTCGLVLNISTGSVSISPKEILKMLIDAVSSLPGGIFGGGSDLLEIINANTQSQIIFSIRIPRLLLAAVLGGALSVSGFLLQTFFQNPIAGPFVLGISSGAKMVVGATIIFFARHISVMNSGVLIFAAFAGSLVITLIVLLFSQRVRNMSMLLVIGIMVGYICSAVTDFCVTFANDQDIVNLTNWSMGTFSGADWKNVATAAFICIPGCALAWLLSKPMGAYALGEGYAKSMGVNIKGLRITLVLLSSLLSACVTALAGPISFVGIAVPHITRMMLKSARPAIVIPASFLCGAVFCIFCDLIARTVFAPTELAIGTVTSVFGAPVVIYMMIRRRKGQED